MAIPLIAGPGAITFFMILAHQAETFLCRLSLVAAIVITLAVIYLILRGADTFLKKLGTTGTRVIQRIMGLLLIVIAVQLVIDGLTPVLKNILVRVELSALALVAGGEGCRKSTHIPAKVGVVSVSKL